VAAEAAVRERQEQAPVPALGLAVLALSER